MAGQVAADGPAVEHQRVQRDAGEVPTQPVEHGDQAHDLALDAGLLAHLLDRHLAGRVADVGPARRVQPDARVGPLHQQDLAPVVAHHRAHRDLRRLVAGHAVADRAHPLVHQGVGLEVAAGGHPHVGGHRQHLLEPLALVQALGEARARCGRCRPAPRSSARGPATWAAGPEPASGRRYPTTGGTPSGPGQSAARMARSSSRRCSGSVDLAPVAVAHVERVDHVEVDASAPWPSGCRGRARRWPG